MKVRRLGVLANFRKAEIQEILTSIIELFPDETTIVGQEKTANLLPEGKIKKVDSFEGCDTVLALGGDGTLLRAARLVADLEIPLLGIKIRSLGFLTEDEPKRAVEELLEGRFVLQERLRLDVAVMRDGKLRQTYSALNDAVIHGMGVSRVIRLKTTIDGAVLGEYLSDGVIISTPTGSTAYSLAAGGPIVNPTSLAAFIITPLCPHSLSVRPVVVSADEVFKVELVENYQETLLTIDGQQTLEIKGGDSVIFRKSPLVTKLIVTESYNFYNLVRRKLMWGGVLREH